MFMKLVLLRVKCFQPLVGNIKTKQDSGQNCW